MWVSPKYMITFWVRRSMRRRCTRRARWRGGARCPRSCRRGWRCSCPRRARTPATAPGTRRTQGLGKKHKGCVITWERLRHQPPKNDIQEKSLTVTLVTVTQYRAIWLQWHFSDFPISNLIVKFSCLQWQSISHSLTVTLFGRSRGCHCNRLLLYRKDACFQSFPRQLQVPFISRAKEV